MGQGSSSSRPDPRRIAVEALRLLPDPAGDEGAAAWVTMYVGRDPAATTMVTLEREPGGRWSVAKMNVLSEAQEPEAFATFGEVLRMIRSLGAEDIVRVDVGTVEGTHGLYRNEEHARALRTALRAQQGLPPEEYEPPARVPAAAALAA